MICESPQALGHRLINPQPDACGCQFDEGEEVGVVFLVSGGDATGTPVGPFFGVDPATGRSFEIMSIDIVTVADGLITHIYHLEDWAGVVAQLTAK